ncbi:hypothetical protein HYZ64_00435 [Candidatus Berkelbacteria bacterium]|nr:hypothetical protein [Candidatus Berkelbacteria bacterium]
MKRKLIKFSNYSFCLTLPKFAVERMGWKKGEEVEVEFDEGTEIIKIFKAAKSSNKAAKSEPKQEKPAKEMKEQPKQDMVEPEIQPIPKLRW